MVIIEDTRQKQGKHKKKAEHFEAHGIQVVRSKLPFGDYALAPKVAIDTKASLSEVANNLCGSVSEQRRFLEECKLAQQSGCKLIFLIEQNSLSDASELVSGTLTLKSGKTLPREQIRRSMAIMSERYGCEFRFCNRNDAGRIIEEVLEEYGR